MTISTSGREIILLKVADIALYVVVKYSLIRLSPTMIDIIIGYKIAINHVRRNNIFKIKAIPKNIMKYKITERDRKRTRLNSSHVSISYAVLCITKKEQK